MTVRGTARHGAGFCVLGLLLAALPGPLSAQQPGPARVLTREDLRRSGRTGLAEILQSLDPAFNAPRPSNAGGSDHAPPLTLHGLGADQLLVLLNGRRRHESALLHVDGSVGRGQGMTDLGSIPLSAIERIELYTDGGAARFGFGAVAGVVNIVLKARAAAELDAVLGTTTAGDGTVLQAAATHPIRWGNDGFLQLSAELKSRGATNRALPDLRPQYFPGDPRNDAAARRVTSRLGDPRSDELSGFVHAAKRLGVSVEAYGFAGLSRRRGESGEQWRPHRDDRTVRALFPDGFLPLLSPKIQDGSALAGARGNLLRWSWDVSVGYGRSSFHFDLENSGNASLGPQSPTEFYAGTLRSDQFSADLELSRRISVGRIPPLLLSVGAAYRSEGFQILAGEPDSYRFGAVPIQDGPNSGRIAAPGAQGFPGFRPEEALTVRRGSVAAFAGVSTVVLRRLSLAATGRVESYPESGWRGAYQVSAELGPLRGVTLRGSQGSGARLPGLGQSWYSRTITTIVGAGGSDNRLAPVGSPLAVLLGAAPLHLERSRTTGLGASVTPLPSLTLSADYYRVTVGGRIILSGTFDAPVVQQYLAQRRFPEIGGVGFFNNALDTRTTGVDAAAAYRVRLGTAELRLRAAFNHNTTRVTAVDSIAGVLAQFQDVLFSRVERARIERGQPRDNLILAGELVRGSWTVQARAQRFGAVASFGEPADGSLDQTFAARWIGDLSASFRTRAGPMVSLGADNLFDTYPERNNRGDANLEGNSNFGVFPYNTVSPFGFNGRLVYLRASWAY